MSYTALLMNYMSFVRTGGLLNNNLLAHWTNQALVK